MNFTTFYNFITKKGELKMKVKNKLAKNMAENGIKLNTWGKAKGLNIRDLALLQQISRGLVKGKWDRSKELREMLEKDGFEVD